MFRPTLVITAIGTFTLNFGCASKARVPNIAPATLSTPTSASSSSAHDHGLGECDPLGTVTPSSDPNIEDLRKTMVAFRASLSPTLLAKSSNCLHDQRLHRWHNTPSPIAKRDGITYGDLDANQLKHFKVLLRRVLSHAGYQKVDEITVLAEGFLSELRPMFWNPGFYSIDMFGSPESSGSWGFQLDGHHCAITFIVHGDTVSMVPAFLGGEPVKKTYRGRAFDIFKNERNFALAMYQGLTDSERSSAIQSGSSAQMLVGPAAINDAGGPDPFRGDYDYSNFKTGLKYPDMSPETQEKLIALAREYVYNLSSHFADLWWADVQAHIDETYFVWIDEVDNPTTTSQFYYRIYNPYLWVEYNMEEPVGEGLEAWNHAHTITRIPNTPAKKFGGDYGIFAHMVNRGGPATLYEHYALAEHHKGSKMQLDYRLTVSPEWIPAEGG